MRQCFFIYDCMFYFQFSGQSQVSKFSALSENDTDDEEDDDDGAAVASDTQFPKLYFPLNIIEAYWEHCW